MSLFACISPCQVLALSRSIHTRPLTCSSTVSLSCRLMLQVTRGRTHVHMPKSPSIYLACIDPPARSDPCRRRGWSVQSLQYISGKPEPTLHQSACWLVSRSGPKDGPSKPPLAKVPGTSPSAATRADQQSRLPHRFHRLPFARPHHKARAASTTCA